MPDAAERRPTDEQLRTWLDPYGDSFPAYYDDEHGEYLDAMFTELLALRARVAELEDAQRADRCQATTVDPSRPERPSCAWCVLPTGHQGMHRAELPQDHSEPAILEWPSEVTE